MPTVFLATHLFAQVKAVRPLAKKTVVTTSATKPIINPKPPKTENPPPKPTDLQSAVVNIVVGDDGKDNDTGLRIFLSDENKRNAAVYPSLAEKGYAATKDEYFVGETVTLPMTTEASVPTGEIKQVGVLPLPVLREATPADFSGGGDVRIQINPNGHDTWKIATVSLTLSFNNDSSSPHKITWSNIVLSQDSRNRDLLFDKNFNPIQ